MAHFHSVQYARAASGAVNMHSTSGAKCIVAFSKNMSLPAVIILKNYFLYFYALADTTLCFTYFDLS
jgi:hypothetical protein